MVPLLERLPGQIAEVLKDPDIMRRRLTPEELEELKVLNRKFDHFGGAREEWWEYLNSPAALDLFMIEEDSPGGASVATLAVGRRKDSEFRGKLAFLRAFVLHQQLLE